MSALIAPPESSSLSPGAEFSPARAAHPAGARQGGRAWLVGLGAAWVLAGTYVFLRLGRNWVPHDDGVLAQAAERVLLGEVPHRDFAEVYTGGLDYLNALGFRAFGVHLMALRYLLFGFFVVWVPVLYYCASRFVTPFAAVVITLLSVLWSVPNYAAAMPSWYNLFFATFGTAALLRFTEARSRRWIFVAGLMGGCSVLAKIAGLYYVAAVLLFLVVHEGLTEPTGSGLDQGRGYRLLIGSTLVGFAAILALLVRGHLTAANVYHFFIPGTGLALLTWRIGPGMGMLPTSQRLARLGRLAWPFLAGVAIPIAAFVGPAAEAGALHAILQGVFVSPSTRLTAASRPALEWPAIIPAALLAAIVVIAVRSRTGPAAWAAASAWAAALPAVALLGGADYWYRISWASVSQTIPLVITAGVIVLFRQVSVKRLNALQWEQAFLFLAIAGLASLIEFPYSAPVYFCYTAPLSLVALTSLLQILGGFPQPLTRLLVLYNTAFAVLVLNTQSVFKLGFTAVHNEPLTRLELPRGGVLVPMRDAAEYRAAIDTLIAHAHGSFTYAGPDAPEIYFLSGLHNPTRAFFDFLEPSEQAPDRVLAAIDRTQVTAVVINRFVKFSDPLSPELEAAFASRFPHEAQVGRFTVRWE